jgi:hypothetical protein
MSVSHVVTITTEVRDPAAVAAACRRLGLPGPQRDTVMLFGGDVLGPPAGAASGL